MLDHESPRKILMHLETLKILIANKMVSSFLKIPMYINVLHAFYVQDVRYATGATGFCSCKTSIHYVHVDKGCAGAALFLFKCFNASIISLLHKILLR